MKVRSFPLCMLIMFFTVTLAASVQATTYLVRPDGSGDFPTIQAAVDGASGGDVIELADGVFTGDGNRDVAYNGKEVTVRSRSGEPDWCVIDCQGSSGEPHRGFLFDNGEGQLSVLRDVTIRHGWSNGGGAIHIMAAPSILHCVFEDNHAPESEGGGIRIEFDCEPTVSDCVFLNNSAWGGGGLAADNGLGYLSATVVGCTFYGNTATDEGGGVRL